MRGLALIACASVLGACADTGAGGGEAKVSYTLDHGVATYDALKAATDKCQAEGGVIKLKSGYDNRELSNYDCKIGAAR